MPAPIPVYGEVRLEHDDPADPVHVKASDGTYSLTHFPTEEKYISLILENQHRQLLELRKITLLLSAMAGMSVSDADVNY